jgi:hypothetical protein
VTVRSLHQLSLLIALLGGCGGSTKASFGDLPAAGSANGGTAGGAHGGGGAAAGGSTGTGGAMAAGGDLATGGDLAGGAGEAGARAGAASGGSKPNDPAGGASGNGGSSSFSCSKPYSGSQGGPRPDGPEPIVSVCSAIPDEVIVTRFESFASRVPHGFYYEPEEPITFWKEPCSMSEADTVARGPTDGMGTFEASYTTPWFYEASYCLDGLRRTERNLRCDYFDGQKLAPHTQENLLFFASLRWWRDHHNVSGAAIIGYSVMVGNATDWVDLCTISGSVGDFGLCDEIRVERTRLSIFVDGKVTVGATEPVRTVKGTCH